MSSHGLLIGKFYPPHAGHHAVIRRASTECRRVTVVVMASAAETIALSDRVSWLRAEHANDDNVSVVGIPCDCPLDLGSQTVWAAQVAAIRAAVCQLTTDPVDALYCGDQYGDELAARLSAKHVDVERMRGGASARVARADLGAAWTILAPATRAGLATRVVVLGAESTGTTTVSERLAAHYCARGGAWAMTRWVGEYGRDFTAAKWAAAQASAVARGERSPKLGELVWTEADFDLIAAQQTARENEAAAAGSPVLVCDTDAFATSVWQRRYLGSDVAPLWSRPPALPRHDLYLLTDHADVPWPDDGMREGDLAMRAVMTGWFTCALTRDGHSWVLLTGSLDERVSLATRTIDQLLAHRMRFGMPLTGPGFERSV